MFRQGKSITRISIYCSKIKTLLFLNKRWSNVANLPLDQLVNLENGVI